jgi:hypothetical protein
MNKKIKVLAVIFTLSFALGGTFLTRAYTPTVELVNYKADFLSVHETGKKDKNTWSQQKLVNMRTSDDRTVLISLWNYKPSNRQYYTSGGSIYYSIKTGDTKTFGGTDHMVPTSESGMQFLLRAKLALPWTQVLINGTWVVDL